MNKNYNQTVNPAPHISRWFVGSLTALILFWSGSMYGQSVCSNVANNNGNGKITFNFTNNNAFAVIITDISSVCSSTTPTLTEAWYRPTPLAFNGAAAFPPLTVANWTQFGNSSIAGIGTTGTVPQSFFNGTLNLVVPAGATYGICINAANTSSPTVGNLRYSTLATGVTFTTTGGGCSMTNGGPATAGASAGGAPRLSTPNFVNYPRGFVGCVTFIPAVACSGMPNAGTISSPAAVCPATSFTVTSSGLTAGTGITYQWQSAPSCAGPWTNAPGGNGTNLITSLTSTTSYKVITTCANSALSNESNCVTVATNPFFNCYCASTATSTADEEILNVSFGTLNNSSVCGTLAPGPGSVAFLYSNYRGFVTIPTVSQGQTVPFALTLGYCGATAFSNTAAIYIDYNQNGLFTDAGEMIFSKPYGPVAVTGQVFPGNTTIPISAVTGQTAMRVAYYETSVINPCGTPSSWGETEDYLINIIATVPCSGTPTPGTTLASSNPVCSTQSFTLSISNIPSSSGNTYQWQSSPDNITWTNIGGATGAAYNALQSTATWYRNEVTCSSSGLSDLSTALQVNQTLCYCVSNATSTADDEIFNVTLGALSNSSTCAVVAPGGGSLQNRYSNYVGYAAVPNLTQSVSYPMSVTVGQCNGVAFSGYVRVYFDFNQNGNFADAGEIAYTSGLTTFAVAGTVLNFPVNISGCATPGNTRMRVIAEESAIPSVDGCGTYSWGETEDYLVNIVTGPVIPPVATSISGPVTGICNIVYTFSVAAGSTGTIQWQYSITSSSGPWIDIANANSVNQTLVSNGPATFFIRARFTGSGCVPDDFSNVITWVVSGPPITLTYSTPSTNICRGQQVVITANSTGPWSWSTGATTQSITVVPLTNSTYSVNAGSGLCTSFGSVSFNIIGGPVAAATVTPSAAHCPGMPVNLNANQILNPPNVGYVVNQIPFAPVTGVGTTITLADDQLSAAIPLPFPFIFYGNTYTNIYISSNGFVSFDAAAGSGCCSGQILPNTLAPNNLIAIQWEDLYPPLGGTIDYFSTGTKFVIRYTGIGHFSGGAAPLTGQIVLNNDNSIELHITSATTDGDGVGETQGIENAGGTQAVAVPGRNGVDPWSSASQAYKFEIPLLPPFTYVGPVTFSWVGSNGFTSSNMNDVDFPTVNTTYTLTVADDVCSSASSTLTSVHIPPTVSTMTGSPYCEGFQVDFFTDGTGTGGGGSSGTLVVNVNSTGWMDETTWQIRNNLNNVIATGGPFGFGSNVTTNVTPLASDYPITFFMETQGTIGDNFGNFSVTCSATSTILTSGSILPNQTFTSAPYTCSGGGGGSLNYSWSGPNGFTSSLEDPIVYNAAASQSGTYTVTVTDANGCTATASTFVDVTTNPVAVEIASSLVSCYGFSDGSFQVAAIGGTPLYNFDVTGVGSNPGGGFSGLPDGVYEVNITDNNGCVTQAPLFVTVGTVPNAPPVISCPAGASMNNDPGFCGAMYSYTPPVGSDVCPIIGTAQTAGLGSSGSTNVRFPVGNTVNTFTVTDALGVTTSCSFSVAVADAENPTITNCPSNFSSCNPISWTPPSVTDNCLGVQMTASVLPNTNFGPGSTVVTYTAVDAYNNASVCQFTVTRLEESVAAVDMTSNRDFNNICQGESIILTINGGSLGDGASWKWYSGSCGGTPLPAFNGMTSITVAPSATTTYFARAEGTCNPGGTACVSATVTVSTGAPNGVVITSAPAVGAPGFTGVVTCTPVPGATFYRWTSILGHINAIWFNGSPGPVETSTNSVNISFQLPQQNYQIRVVAGNACGRSNNASVQIRGSVEAPTCLNGPTQACPGQSNVAYSVAACPSPGANGYQWIVTATPAGTAVIAGGQGTTAITVNYLAGFNSATVCVAGLSQFNLPGPSTCVTVSTTAAAPGPISGNALPCRNSTELYTIAPVLNASSYLWTVTGIPGATVSGTGTTGTVVFPNTAFTGQVQVQAVTTCGTSAATTFNVISGAAGIPGPIFGPASGICGASNVGYSLGTNDANTYNWILPAGVTLHPLTPGTLNAVSLDFSGSLSGPVTITVEAFYNCGSATSNIVVSGVPGTPTITPNVICPGDDELYFASAPGADYFTWSVTGQDYAECSNPNCSQYYVIWGPSGGTLSVTATNGCGTSAPGFVTGSCRISGTELETKVYPNPTNGKLTVEYGSYSGGKYRISVTDMAGRTVFTNDVTAHSGLNRFEMDLGFANPGMYMIYLTDASGRISVLKVTLE